jgi:hypothetical protein
MFSQGTRHRLSPRLTPVIIVILTCLGCARHPTPPYAIRDFPDSLQPWLIRAVNSGFVDNYDTATEYLKNHLSDSAILLLSFAENPILRATALERMVKRPGFNHQRVMWAHLDDTAIIPERYEEYQHGFSTVTDHMIEYGGWKTEHDRDSLANEIILHHSYLLSACDALSFMPAPPQYYEHIKRIVVSDRMFERHLGYALFALASYRKKEDIALIKATMLHSVWRLDDAYFHLMTEYPDTAYLEVLRHYYNAWRDKLERGYGPPDDDTSYIHTLAFTKSKIGAEILTRILTLQPWSPHPYALTFVKRATLRAIWENPCPALDSIRHRIADTARRIIYEDTAGDLIVDIPIDSSKLPAEPVHWR